MKETSLPQIAIATHNTLTAIGLSAIISRMMPGADVCIFSTFDHLATQDKGTFFHYFVSTRILLEGASYFLERRHKTIVLIDGDERRNLPQDFHTLNVREDEQQLIRSVLRLAQTAHNAHGGEHEAVRRAKAPQQSAMLLTPREEEVLRLIVSGHINKEIANRLNVSLATVISHRKNLTEKLHTKSVSALTIYAVMHGLVKIESI